jgi:hypothetical protein
MNKKAELYNDLYPKTSLKNTGFKNRKTAIHTINLIKSRSLKYQFDVINTMYNRAKYHPNKTPDMEKAMEIFTNWLKKYPKKSEHENKKYPWLPLSKVLEYEKLAEEYGVSQVARGIKPSSISDKGFLQMYKIVGGKKHKLQYIPVKLNKPDGMDYWSYRINFIKSRVGQIAYANTPLFYNQGKYKGKPTKQHVILIMHGFSPKPNDI